ncbi:MAG: class I SAM-dependent methyltransferase [Eubacterium sp.]|jgi:cyclopropane fatty-acyl-phospholipid synthase-like methyltransferase|nr:class I SAM-dependent methyltransferase [Eubacterium sp.]
MNYYEEYLSVLDDNAHLISMVSVEELLRFGYELGLKEGDTVLDLCCGYGTLLKVWNEAFRICGTGVDLNEEFLSVGRDRMQKNKISDIALICGDVTTYQDNEKYDVVICSETISSISETLLLGEKFLKAGGVLGYQKLYSKIENPPQELVDFDEEVLTLSELNDIFNQQGFQMISMASDNMGMWERYVLNWSGKRDLLQLSQNENDKNLRSWVQKWYNMYFKYRRQYEGQALFGLQRILDSSL